MSSRLGHSFAMQSLALLPLYLGLANAQAPVLSVGADLGVGVDLGGLLPSGCPSVLTVTVLPDDYTGTLVGQPTLPCLPTLIPNPLTNLPGVVSSLLGALPTASPSVNLPDIIFSVLGNLPTGLPITNLPDVISSVIAGLPTDIPITNLPDVVSSVLGGLPTNVPLTNLPGVISSILDIIPLPTPGPGGLPGGTTLTPTLPNTALPPITAVPGQLTSALGCIPTIAASAVPALLSSVLASLPTDLPLEAIPGALSSVLGCLPTGLPASQLPGQLSSILDSLPTELPINSIISGLQSDLPILTELPDALSSVLSGLPGVVTGLPGIVSSVLSDLGPAVTGLPGAVESILSNLPGVVTPLPSGLESIVSEIVGGGGLPLPTPSIKIPLTTELPNALSSIIAGLPSDVPLTNLPGVVSSVINNLPSNLPIVSDLENGVSSILNGLTTGLPITNIGPALSSIIDGVIPTALPTNNPLTNLIPTGGNPLTNLLPTGSNPLTNLIPGLTNLLPPVATPTGTNLVSTTDANGLPTLVSITPTVILPDVTVSTPGGLTNLPTNLIPTLATGLGSIISNLIPTGGNPLTNLIPGSGGGNGGTATSTSSGVVPTASVRPAFTCPTTSTSTSPLTYVAPNGRAFQISCNTNYPAFDLSTSLQPDMYSCVNSCGSIAGCNGVTYQASTSTCYYKGATGNGVASTAFAGAAPVDLSCPRADGAYYTDSVGAMYQILCNVLFPSSVRISQSVAVVKREEGVELVKRVPGDTAILGCSNRCSNLDGCIAVTKTGTTCDYISELGNSAAGSTIADSVVLVGRSIPAIDTNGQTVTSTSRPPAPPTSVSSRAISATNNAPPSTITSGLPIVSDIAPIVSSVVGDVVSGLSSVLGDTGNAISFVGSGAGSAVPCLIGAVGGLICAGGACIPTTATAATRTPSSSSMTGSASGSSATAFSSRSMITTVVPVTTITTYTTITTCSTGYLGGVVCPVVNVTSELIGSRTTVVPATTSTASTLSTLTRSSSSSRSSSSGSSSASPTPTCLLTNSPLLGLVCL